MSFTLKDTLGILLAATALVPVLLAPGYAIGWGLDLFEFRHRRPILRLLLGVPLTIATTPTIVFLLARFLPPALALFYAASLLIFLFVAARDLRTWRWDATSKNVYIGAGLTITWAMVAIGSLVDLQLGKSLYLPIPAYDHSTRVAILGALSRHMPPMNPFFANPGVPLRYHYLWMMLLSMPLKVVNLPLRDLTYAGVVWCGIGLMGLIAAGCKFLLKLKERLEERALIAIVLLTVTGLDILPTLYMAAAQRTWQADMEWWNEVQISSWAASLLWVPHNLAALIACTIGFLLIRNSERRLKSSVIAAAVAGFAFASAVGLSVYVTFTFVLIVGLWMLYLCSQKQWNETAMFAAAGIIAGVAAAPFLKSISGPGGGSGFVDLALRPFPLGVHFADKLGLPTKNAALITSIKALGLPFNYLLELGFFLGILAYRIRKIWRGAVRMTIDEASAWVLIAAGFIVGSFLKSSTIETNDLGIRCFLPAQFVLLLWGAGFVDDWFFRAAEQNVTPSRRARLVMTALLTIGVISTVYEVTMFRIFPVLKDRGLVAGVLLLDVGEHAGERTFALRSLYENINEKLPSTAVVQSNPLTRNTVTNAMYSAHDTAAGSTTCGITFGGQKEMCFERLGRLYLLYNTPEDTPASACRDYGIDVVVVEDNDPVWKRRDSWVWTEQPMFASDYARAFRCSAPNTAKN